MPCRACKAIHSCMAPKSFWLSDSCALFLMDYSAWPIFRELLGCSIPCLREHLVIIVFEPAVPGHYPDQFRLRWLRPILTGEFARSLVLFQKGLFVLPVSLSVFSAVLFDGFTLQFVPAGLDQCVHCSAQSSTVGRGWRDAPPAALFGGHGRFQIPINIAWLLLMLVQVSQQISVPPLMSLWGPTLLSTHAPLPP